MEIISSENFKGTNEILELILNSAILPIIESQLRGGSMLEMVKDEKIISCYLDMVKIISQHKNLIPALLPLSKEFYPN